MNGNPSKVEEKNDYKIGDIIRYVGNINKYKNVCYIIVDINKEKESLTLYSENEGLFKGPFINYFQFLKNYEKL